MTLAKKILGITLIAVAGCCAAVYAGDYVSAKMRGANADGNGAAFDTVKVEPTYAILQKNGKDNFVLGDPEYQTCIRSLFPHFGYDPCWYVRRNAQKMIQL